MYKLEINNKPYKTLLIFLTTLSIPCMFAIFYGVELLNYNNAILGYIVLVLGLSGALLALNSLFALISCLDSNYDWERHCDVTNEEELILKSKPFVVNRIKLTELKKMEIKKTDIELEVRFITEEKEINCIFTKESYDTLIFFKKKYIIGW